MENNEKIKEVKHHLFQLSNSTTAVPPENSKIEKINEQNEDNQNKLIKETNLVKHVPHNYVLGGEQKLGSKQSSSISRKSLIPVSETVNSIEMKATNVKIDETIGDKKEAILVKNLPHNYVLGGELKPGSKQSSSLSRNTITPLDETVSFDIKKTLIPKKLTIFKPFCNHNRLGLFIYSLIFLVAALVTVIVLIFTIPPR